MTTVAYKDKELAFDSKVTDSSGAVLGAVVKGAKLPAGSLAAFAGDLAHCQLFHKWAAAGFLNDSLKLSLDNLKDPCYTGIVVNPKGIITVYNDSTIPVTYTSKMYSWGSGGGYAMGAMVFGASAKEAVQVAKICDVSTGGRVRVLKLED